MKKLFLALPWIMNCDETYWGDRPTLCHKHGWEFVHRKYDNYTFSLDKEIIAIKTFIEENNYDQIIICGASFGEIIARKLLSVLSETTKQKVVAHISISGVSTYDDAPQNKIQFLKRIQHMHGTRQYPTLKKILGFFYFFSRQFSPSFLDKLLVVGNEADVDKIDVTTIAVYSPSDTTNYPDPKQSAQMILDACTEKTLLVEASPAGHASFRQDRKTYNRILENIFSWVENK